MLCFGFPGGGLGQICSLSLTQTILTLPSPLPQLPLVEDPERPKALRDAKLAVWGETRLKEVMPPSLAAPPHSGLGNRLGTLVRRD